MSASGSRDPIIDVLFESACVAYDGDVTAVVLTGANEDGTQGASTIKRWGGRVIVQDPEEATSRRMPMSVIRSVPVDFVLRARAIAGRITLDLRDDRIHGS